jgi:hypothetical protein
LVATVNDYLRLLFNDYLRLWLQAEVDELKLT